VVADRDAPSPHRGAAQSGPGKPAALQSPCRRGGSHVDGRRSCRYAEPGARSKQQPSCQITLRDYRGTPAGQARTQPHGAAQPRRGQPIPTLQNADLPESRSTRDSPCAQAVVPDRSHNVRDPAHTTGSDLRICWWQGLSLGGRPTCGGGTTAAGSSSGRRAQLLPTIWTSSSGRSSHSRSYARKQQWGAATSNHHVAATTNTRLRAPDGTRSLRSAQKDRRCADR
jgi:hypothetical protein